VTLLEQYRRQIASEYAAADATLDPPTREARLQNAARWERTAQRLELIIARRKR